MRGTLIVLFDQCRYGRFIPACAGNTKLCAFREGIETVHPRVCGEHVSGSLFRKSANGSSPRVRGTRLRCRVVRGLTRFIPACAGNTITIPHPETEHPVHPRVCGEHGIGQFGVGLDVGSSPRVRGTLIWLSIKFHLFRFIPACAGNTRHRPPATQQYPVHPRVCGEHTIIDVWLGSPYGSSPRVRGTHETCPAKHFAERFIPACAGNTPGQIVPFINQAVHPRVCGEHSFTGFPDCHASGSSPRVRGTHLAVRVWVFG